MPLCNQLADPDYRRLMVAIARLQESDDFALLADALNTELRELTPQLLNSEGRALTLLQGKGQALTELNELLAGAKDWLRQHN